MDFEKLEDQANIWAQANLDCKVVLVGTQADRETPGGVAVFNMVDDEGEVTGSVTVRDGGIFGGRQMMEVKDDDGWILCEAFGDMLARILYV